MSNTASTITLAAIFVTVVGVSNFWIARSLDGLRDEMRRGFDAIEARLTRIEGKFDDHETRISRLEGTRH